MNRITVTVPIPPPSVVGEKPTRRYLQRELKRYFPGPTPVITFEQDESITAVVGFKDEARWTLTCEPGSDDDWFSFSNK